MSLKIDSDSLLHYAVEQGINLASRTIILDRDIEKGSFQFISSRLSLLESSPEPIVLEIKSEGGDIYEAMAIVGRMRQSPCKITTIGYGQIMSAAVAILAAGHTRLISRYSWGLHHEMYTDMEGKIKDLQIELAQRRREEEKWAEVMEEFTNTPKQLWLELQKEESYLTPEQCLQYGIVDKII